jgi:NADH:ubiquinone oxidoreductase subunit F (NADH-binding)
MDGATLPRLLAGWRPGEPISFDEHLSTHGALPIPDSRQRHELIEEVERSGLRGRGGAGFPTAAKLRAVAGARRGRRVVVVNGAEGEPASAKDRALLAGAPHLVLDGALLAAAAVGASEVIVCVKWTGTKAMRAVETAIRERAADQITLFEVPPGYVAGEETALVNYINTGRALPTFVPPRPYERGVGGRPTLMQNPETLAHLALVARYGSDWFRQVGAEADPGSNLVTLRGSVARPGVYEIASGASLGSLLDAAGGATEPIQAFLVGGYAGSWVPAERAGELCLGRARGGAREPSLGAGVVIALPAAACGFCETGRVVGYLAEESAGQCGPCIHGVRAIADAFAEIGEGRAEPGAHRWIESWSADVVGRGACGHPDGAAALATSALYVFRDAVAAHEAGGSCGSRNGRPWTLPLPEPLAVAR